MYLVMNNQEIALDIPDLLGDSLHLQVLDQVYRYIEDLIVVVIVIQEICVEIQHQSKDRLSKSTES